MVKRTDMRMRVSKIEPHVKKTLAVCSQEVGLEMLVVDRKVEG